ncbi:gliding motility lipoprotein GldH [Flavobacterium sp.]|uniref:gliding motility lipoprotein GldH n=1 Tax=Flavobacterium sp. TaxID=239 RepID=UPI00352801C7
MRLKKSKYWIMLVFFGLLVACDGKQVFDSYQKLDGNWAKNDSIRFEFEQTDTINPYNLFLNIRDNKKYPFSNIFLIVNFKNPKNEVKIDTLEYEMAFPNGELMGSGFSDIKENKLWYQENFTFNKSGKYEVIITQAVRETGEVNGVEELPGITEIGFRIEKTN